MKNIKKSVLISLAALAIVGLGSTYAYFSDTLTVINHISTGDVNIALKEYEIQDGKEVAYTNPKQIVPGQTVSKIPRITNRAEPCWVRAKISYNNSNSGKMEGLSDSDISGMPDEWVKKGDYYYLTDILEHSEKITLFNEVHFPAEWTEEYAGQKIKINIQADAIQAANFTPNFDDMSPWGNEEIEVCIHESEGKIISKDKNVKLSVEFNGEAHKLIAAPDDFFANFQTAMPGDQFTDSVEISNTTDNEAEIFFRTALEGQTEEQLDFLDKLQLKISMNGQELYSGNLKAEGINKDISLGKYQAGQGGRLDFAIKVPVELKNAYALRKADVKWIFTVNENEITPTPEAQEHEQKGTDAVRTGDKSPILALCMILAGGVIVGLIILKKHKKDTSK